MTEGLDELRLILGRMRDTPKVADLLLKAGRKTGVEMENLFSEYPESPKGRPLTPRYPRISSKGVPYLSKFKTMKQQGWFFANLNRFQSLKKTLSAAKKAKNKGLTRLTQISLKLMDSFPYKRTGLLGRSFTSETKLDGNVISIEIGTPVPYAPYVIGDLQWYYHAETGWKNVPEELEQQFPELAEFFADVFSVEYQSYLFSGR